MGRDGEPAAVTLWSATREGAPRFLERLLGNFELRSVGAVLRGAPFTRPSPRDAAALAARREAAALLSRRSRSGLHRFEA